MNHKYHLLRPMCDWKTICGSGGGRYRNNYESAVSFKQAPRSMQCKKCKPMIKKGNY